VATVAFGVGAVASGLSASSRYDDLRGSCGQTPQGCSAADIDAVRSRARRANFFWAATAIAATATGVTAYVNTREVGLAALWGF
jgi:hypothetical protein